MFDAHRPLVARPDLRRFLLGCAVSNLGDGMSFVAVAWLAVRLAPAGHAGPLVGTAVAAYALPGVVGALAFGRWLRRLPARTMLVADCLLRAAALGAIPLVHAAGLLAPAVYVVLLGCSSLLHAWGAAGTYTLLAERVPAEQRLAANSVVATLSSAALIAGPALAGLLTGAVGPAWVIGFDAVSFAVFAVQVARLPAGPSAEPTAAAPPVDAGRSATGFRLLLRLPKLAALLGLTWLFYGVYGPFEVAMPLFVSDVLHRSAGVLGLLNTAFGVGAVLGGLAAGALRRLPMWPVMIGIVAGWGLCLLPFGLAGLPGWGAALCLFAGGLVYGPYPPLSTTLFQSEAPAEHLAPVLAARTAIVLCSSPLGTAAGGPLVAALGPGRTLFASGAVTVGVALAAAAVRAAAVRGRAAAYCPDDA